MGTWVLRGLGAFVCAATLLPLFQSRRWWIRMFDYPRVQVLALGATYAAVALARSRRLDRSNRRLAVAVGAAALGQLAQIYPFTRLARPEVVSCREGSNAEKFTILCSNVLEKNREAARLLALIHRHKPDLVLLTETDEWWADQLKELEEIYPFQVEQPIHNTYGMILYSKLPLQEPRVRFLVHDDIPSISTRVQLPNQQTFRLIGVHPRPPATEARDGHLRGSGARDVELVLVAKEVRDEGGPAIVAGDFNDVAWSHTTRLFKRIAKMLDPRVGRGFYSTFPAHCPCLRYPLDHLFHTKHFELVSFQRLGAIGSDHFPILATLDMAPEAPLEQSPTPAEPEDFEEASETVAEPPKP